MRQVKDSGERSTYESGMQREPDNNKPRFDLMVAEGVPYDEQILTRFAVLLGKGAAKYTSYGRCTCQEEMENRHKDGCPATEVMREGARNWERANSKEEVDRMKASAFRHFMQWFCGENDEDHATACMFNILAAETTQYKIDNNVV